MSAENRAEIEVEIDGLLRKEWGAPDADMLAAHPDTTGYESYAHELYSLLARGASDSQVGRRIQQAERAELHRPELAEHDQTPLLRALRAIEKRI